jgi:hypothetical protein
MPTPSTADPRAEQGPKGSPIAHAELAAVLGAVRAFRETTGPARTRVADGLAHAPHLRNRGAQTLGSLLTFLAISLVALHIAATSASITAPRSSFRGEEESSMRRLSSVAAATTVTTTVIATLATASSAFAQDAVEWRVADGGNGHWYARYSCAQSRTAMTQLASGLGGYPVAISSSSEQNFLNQSFPDGWVLGLHAPGSSDVFSWMNGEPFAFAHWGTAACPVGPYPNNGGNALERFVATSGFPECGNRWDDYPLGQLSDPFLVMVEFSADCNNDGLVDFGQIRAGELADSNANNIPDCCESSVACDNCPADIDESGTVNGVDLAALLSVWGTDGAKYPRADIDGSGEVNAADLAAVLNSWGACP